MPLCNWIRANSQHLQIISKNDAPGKKHAVERILACKQSAWIRPPTDLPAKFHLSFLPTSDTKKLRYKIFILCTSGCRHEILSIYTKYRGTSCKTCKNLRFFLGILANYSPQQETYIYGNLAIGAVRKDVNLIDLVKSFPTRSLFQRVVTFMNRRRYSWNEPRKLCITDFADNIFRSHTERF